MTVGSVTEKAAPKVPTLEELTAGLGKVLGSPVLVTHRRRNVQTSTFPSEMLTCRLADRSELHLFVKYADAEVNHLHGHRSGVAFEARAYQDVVAPLGLSSARYYGHFDDPAGQKTWLFLDALDAVSRVHKDPRPGAMARAAAWIGQFHQLNESRVGHFADWLHRYDAAYYAGWCRRAAAYAAEQQDANPWFIELCRRCERFLPDALSGAQTIIHGEYYPKNILTHDGVTYPVDWESLAVAPGEIDYASLTENWPEGDTLRACRESYVRSRWRHGEPADFERTVAAAQLYWHFRWLGNRPTPQSARYCSLRQLGEQLGLL
jgi:hypothetical protein